MIILKLKQQNAALTMYELNIFHFIVLSQGGVAIFTDQPKIEQNADDSRIVV